MMNTSPLKRKNHPKNVINDLQDDDLWQDDKRRKINKNEFIPIIKVKEIQPETFKKYLRNM